MGIYNFVRFKHRQREMDSSHILVSKLGISISKLAYEKLGKPQIVEVWFDEKAKAIKIVKSESFRAFKIQFTGRSKEYPIIRARSFYKTMVADYYDFNEVEGIFLIDS